MKLAFTFDYTEILEFDREGIIIFIKNLASAMMEYDNIFELELWSFRINRHNINCSFSEIANKYPSRVKSFDEYSVFSLKLFLKTFLHIVMPLNILRIIKHWLLFICLGRQESKNRLMFLIYAIFTPDSQEALIKAVKKLSKADLVFPSYPMLPLALYFRCKKIMQIHDLYYLANRDLFTQQLPDIDKINGKLTDTLSNYATKDTIFVSSSAYIRDNHILKHIPAIKTEQTRIIPYPPMIKKPDLYTLPKQKDFLEKYNLPERYIAFPSQNRPNKNIIAILQALLILRERSIIINFVTTGLLSHFPPVLEFAKKNDLKNQIFETGDLSEEDLIALYKYSTLVVCPNIIEGPGMSQQCLEALTVEIPVIHAKSFGIKESLESVGLAFETARLNWFDFDDYSGLAEKIDDVLNNPKLHIEKQKHILAYYTKITWKDTAKRYLEFAKSR